MKFLQSLSALTVMAGVAAAFPATFKAAMTEKMGQRAVEEGCPYAKKALEKRALVGFNPTLQHVRTSGAHVFVTPGPTDARGPCPGLNAMANHGYIPHNGVATITQFIQGTYEVFGMGTDLATFLAVYGAVMDGDLTAWSIGGPTNALPPLLGLLGTPTGLDGSHNKYEGDVSPTRGDLYQYGNNYLLQMSQFKSMYNRPLGPKGYDLSVLTPFRAERFQQSIANNPYFFNGPFTGVVVLPAAYTFIYRFMANKSAEYPEGYLNGETLKSFFSITGPPGNFKYNPGNERIPDNWYKRAVGDEYTIPYFNMDLTSAALQYPEFLDIGGNTGKVNTFTGLDINNLTGGVYNAQTLAQGNNAMCFAFQNLQQAMPDILKTEYLITTVAQATLGTAVTTVLSSLGCPQLAKIDQSQYSKFPGYTQSYNGYAPQGGGL